MKMRTRTKSKKILNFKSVKTVYSDIECNELIAKGWRILHVGASTLDHNGFNVKPTFIMGEK